ncbi:hypothetical protein BJY16_007540 [Actinoplanes octamycinicus]|uniref:Secreted protein n=1 Tax=Actinoplanes octamycinicus TaxID=135948 RepID=A0A7W7H4Y1_9ACTN|nr:phage tail assembly protein [Actinoplanes octamycinicus]MBB4744081.1 hypothetical protein [Actinoplanes octamycinicus]GIE56962.1 hypothetical protein Aoc01nite_23640 [Actinoplanes octamycinicus]
MNPPTEFPFTLPRGYTDADGAVHRAGVMRLATAYDEIAPMQDPRVQANPGYLVLILLSRVVLRLGDLPRVNPKVMEGLPAGDLAFLQEFYRRVNEDGAAHGTVVCPRCETEFAVELSGLGG